MKKLSRRREIGKRKLEIFKAVFSFNHELLKDGGRIHISKLYYTSDGANLIFQHLAYKLFFI